MSISLCGKEILLKVIHKDAWNQSSRTWISYIQEVICNGLTLSKWLISVWTAWRERKCCFHFLSVVPLLAGALNSLFFNSSAWVADLLVHEQRMFVRWSLGWAANPTAAHPHVSLWHKVWWSENDRDFFFGWTAWKHTTERLYLYCWWPHIDLWLDMTVMVMSYVFQSRLQCFHILVTPLEQQCVDVSGRLIIWQHVNHIAMDELWAFFRLSWATLEGFVIHSPAQGHTFV